MSADKFVLLVELTGGEVVAVPFSEQERADWWGQRMPFEIVGRPRIVTARSLAVGVAFAKRNAAAAEPSPTPEKTPVDDSALAAFVPSTEQVRAAYDAGKYDADGWHRHDPEGHAAEFGRWLNGLQRGERATGWDEAVRALFEWWQTPEEQRPAFLVNPYGAGLSDEAFMSGGDAEGTP